MATITEDYVSFEVAKLLKEKGFDNISSVMYKENGEICINPKSTPSWRLEYWYPCLTHQMAMKWLREVHYLWCEISPEGKGLWYTEIYSLIDEEYIPNSNSHKNESYEEACEAAIKYCLENLI